jgi:hypothetical protein
MRGISLEADVDRLAHIEPHDGFLLEGFFISLADFFDLG